MSNRVAVFNEGRIEQVGSPAEVYDHPARPWPASSAPRTSCGGTAARSRCGRRSCASSRRAARASPGTIRAAVYVGPVTKVIVDLEQGGELQAVQQNLETSSRDVHEMEGKRVRLAWRRDAEFEIKERGRT